MLVGAHHHGDRVFRVDFAVPFLDTSHHLGGFVELAGADEEPRGFGRVLDENDEGDGPDPLDGKGDLVCPFVGASGHGFEHAGGDELANDPAEVDVGLCCELANGCQGCWGLQSGSHGERQG